MIDYNCYVGAWPFHKLRRYTFEDLMAVHKENGIEYGYVSSIQSIFYNDCYESQKEMYETIKDTPYKQVTVINPAISTCVHTLKRCIKEFDISGVRLAPGYHGYNINSDVVKPVIDIAREYNLPLFITARMLDERLTHMIHPEIISGDDVRIFAQNNKDVTIVLCHFKDAQMPKLEDVLLNNPRLFTDISGFASPLLSDDGQKMQYKKAVLGTGWPLKNVKSTVMRIEIEIKELYDNRFDKDIL